MFDMTAYIATAEARIRAAGIPLQQFLEDAGLNRSTWSRWKSGAFEPRMSALRKIDGALSALPKRGKAA